MKIWSQIFSLLNLFIFIGFIQGCDGGGDGIELMPPTQNATGIWQGTITEDGVGTYNVTGIVSGNQLRFISTDAGAIYVGTVSVSSSNFAATTTNFSIASGEAFATSELSGNVMTKTKITGSFKSSNGATGSFSLQYDKLSAKESDLATVSATWEIPGGGAPDVWLNIDPAGVLTGEHMVDGCNYNGLVSIIDSAVNIYQVETTVTADPATACVPLVGDYAGFAVVADTNNTLIYVVSNDDYIFYGSFIRS